MALITNRSMAWDTNWIPDKIFSLLLPSRNVTRRMSTAMMKAFEVAFRFPIKDFVNWNWITLSVSGNSRTDDHLQGCSCLGSQEAPWCHRHPGITLKFSLDSFESHLMTGGSTKSWWGESESDQQCPLPHRHLHPWWPWSWGDLTSIAFGRWNEIFCRDSSHVCLVMRLQLLLNPLETESPAFRWSCL